MTTQHPTLRRIIMRRIYYAYGLSIVSNPMLLQGMALAVSVALFAQFVHVASLIDNLMHTEVGYLPYFVFNAFARGEVLTILAVGVIFFTTLSFPWRLLHGRVPGLQFRRTLSHQ